jgi:hypothetical protein
MGLCRELHFDGITGLGSGLCGADACPPLQIGEDLRVVLA